jgi:hypothetical protein
MVTYNYCGPKDKTAAVRQFLREVKSFYVKSEGDTPDNENVLFELWED